MTLTQAASALAVSAKTLRLAAERGEVEAQHPLADGPWIFNRSSLELTLPVVSEHRIRIPPRDMTLGNKPSIYQRHSQMG